jgi:hypothetical protein
MSRRSIFMKAVVLSATFFPLVVLEVSAGDRVHAPSRATTRTQVVSAAVAPTTSPSVRLQGSVAVVVATPAPTAPEPFSVDIRGPDGQVRRFPVEGGRAAIQYRQVILHPGDMLTIRWKPTK